jgi:hypothetical protein
MSGWSVNRPSNPVRRKATCSSMARPYAAGSVPTRRSAGRNWFSARKVYGITLSPAACASATRLVGEPRVSSARRGMIWDFSGPRPSA